MAARRVLMYHAFGSRPAHEDVHNLFVPVQDLERQVRHVARRCRPLDLDGFLAAMRTGSWPRRWVLVTIDDGYASTVEVAAPLLARHGVPAVAFVCSGHLGGTATWLPSMADEPLLTADQVRELPGFGIEVGSHGVDHDPVIGLGSEDLRFQVGGSAEALADLVGLRPRVFSYPGGAHDAATRRAVREAGYEAGFAASRGEGRFAIPRRSINARDSFTSFRAKLTPGFTAVERSLGAPPLRRLAGRVMGQRKAVTR